MTDMTDEMLPLVRDPDPIEQAEQEDREVWDRINSARIRGESGAPVLDDSFTITSGPLTVDEMWNKLRPESLKDEPRMVIEGTPYGPDDNAHLRMFNYLATGDPNYKRARRIGYRAGLTFLNGIPPQRTVGPVTAQGVRDVIGDRGASPAPAADAPATGAGFRISADAFKDIEIPRSSSGPRRTPKPIRDKRKAAKQARRKNRPGQ